MKRASGLFPQITDFRNLSLAARKALKGKKSVPQVGQFFFHQENELIELQQELLAKTYQPRPYATFVIYEPKPRNICCSHIRDRVVHHAICNIIDPIFERRYIYDTYACRIGKGTHKAILRLQHFAKAHKFYLKCDIQKYFETMDHTTLKALLRKIFKDKDLLNLFDVIIDHKVPGNPLGKGIPIGNLTSQHFANFCLGELDLFIKGNLRVKGYVRYMDDFVLFGDDKAFLRNCLKQIDQYVRERLHVRLKESVTTLAPVSEGISYLGFRVYPALIRIKRQNLVRLRRKIKTRERQYTLRYISESELAQSVGSMISHIRLADSQSIGRKEFIGLA